MKSALLVIDVQRGLFNEATKPYEGGEIIERINELTEKARAAKVPVIFIQQERKEGSLVYLSPSWELALGLKAKPTDRYIRKTTPDSFLRTDLNTMLDKGKINHLFICGFASEFCVDTTVRSAAAHGYPVTLIADCHSTYEKDHAPAKSIIAHENATLPTIKSFDVKIEAIASTKISFSTPNQQNFDI